MAFVGGAFNELDFLTNIPILNNHDNRDSIFNWVRGEVDIDEEGNLDTTKESKSRTVIFKSKTANDTKTIKNYYKDTIYKYEGDKQSDLNPYLKLIRDFEDKTFNSMRFQAADFAYLTDLGVYPMNRMWVLRRFADGVTVQDNLQKMSIYPRETLVGWIKPEDDNFFNFGFNEKWEVMDKRLDEVMMQILEKEFRLKASSIISIPGWSQGLLFAFLNAMKLTNYNGDQIPQGDPAVLQEAAARAKDNSPGYGNVSQVSMTLKTSYEQKFIGEIDPGSAMLDIIQRCIYMGTRETKFVMRGGGGILNTLQAAINTNTPDAWWIFIKEIVKAFVVAIEEIFNSLLGVGAPFESLNQVPPENPPKPEEEPVAAPTEAKDKIKGTLNVFENISDGFLVKILGSTVGKWRYALQGSIGLMTGQNTTPWHLTLGNPYSPFVTFGNVIVESVNLNFNNEFGYNDIPTRLDVEVKVKQGRNMGAQELFQMFNNGYQRVYSASSSSSSEPKSDETELTKTQTENKDAAGNTGKAAAGAISGTIPKRPLKRT